MISPKPFIQETSQNQKTRFPFSQIALIATAAFSLTVISARAQTPTPPTDSQVKNAMERSVKIVPASRQLAWQHQELIAFTHFGVNTFDNREWGTGHEDPKLFNPSAVDCKQWIAALKAAGVKEVILTCKHHDGFCLWPTRYNKHSVKFSPWKNGNGDVVKEVALACRAAGLRFGVYLSPADLFQMRSKGGYYGDKSASVPSVIPTDPASFKSNPSKQRSPLAMGAPVFHFKVDNYNRYFLNQLYELLTQYGPIAEVWFDGANPDPSVKETYDYEAWYALIRKLQPNAVIEGKGPDARWVGNEHGFARESEWSVVTLPKPADQFDWSDMAGKDLGSLKKIETAKYLHWYPAEADVSIRPGWFYHPDQQPKSLQQLLEIYFKSVGRNAVMLLNDPPNRQGRLDEKDVQRLKEFGDTLTAIFKTNLAVGAKATASDTRGNSAKFAISQTVNPAAKGFWMADDWVMNPTITYRLAGTKTFNIIMLQEEIAQSQRIEAFAVDAWENGAWKQIANATTVGEKRLLQIRTVTTNAVRLRISKSRVCPTLKKFGLFYMAGKGNAPEISRDKSGKVTLRSGTKGIGKVAEIRYTTNGSEPTKSSPVYGMPFLLPQGGVVKARAFANDKASEVATKNFDVSKADWRIVPEHGAKTAPGYAAKNAIDANPATIWMTEPSKMPQAIAIDLGKLLTLKGFTYTPRADGHADGIIDHYAFYVSADGRNWGTPVSKGQFGNIKNSPDKQIVKFAKPVSARYIRLVAISEVDGKPIASAAEIGVVTR